MGSYWVGDKGEDGDVLDNAGHFGFTLNNYNIFKFDILQLYTYVSWRLWLQLVATPHIIDSY